MFTELLKQIKLFKHIEKGILLTLGNRWIFIDGTDVYFRPLEKWMFNFQISRGKPSTHSFVVGLSEDLEGDARFDCQVGRLPGLYLETTNLQSRAKQNIQIYGINKSPGTGFSVFLGDRMDEEKIRMFSFDRMIKNRKVK